MFLVSLILSLVLHSSPTGRELIINQSYLASKNLDNCEGLNPVYKDRNLNVLYMYQYPPLGENQDPGYKYCKLESFKVDADTEIMLYAAFSKRRNKIQEVRAATIHQGELKFNASIWMNEDQQYTRVQYDGGVYKCSIMEAGEVSMTYNMLSGEFTIVQEHWKKVLDKN
jgi:hypothetical protein